MQTTIYTASEILQRLGNLLFYVNCVCSFIYTHKSQVSTVPKRHLFALQALLTAGTLSINHFSLKALKYVETGSPDIALK